MLSFFFFKAKLPFPHHFYKSKTFSHLLPLQSCLLLHSPHFSSTTSTFVLHCKMHDKRPRHQHVLAFTPSFAHSLSAPQDCLRSKQGEDALPRQCAAVRGQALQTHPQALRCSTQGTAGGSPSPAPSTAQGGEGRSPSRMQGDENRGHFCRWSWQRSPVGAAAASARLPVLQGCLQPSALPASAPRAPEPVCPSAIASHGMSPGK